MQTRLSTAALRVARNRRLLRLLLLCLLISSFCIASVWMVSGSSYDQVSERRMLVQKTAVTESATDEQKRPATESVATSTANPPSTSTSSPSTSTSTTTTTTTTAAPTTTATTSSPTTTRPVQIPAHLRDLFAVKELKLVALDPIILKCVTSGNCMSVTAAASVQVGTFLKNTEELKTVLNKHLTATGWKIDVICPHAAVITKHYWRGFDKNVAVSVINDDPEKHYYKIEQEDNAEIKERAFDRFNTTELHGLSVPSDIDRFELWWRNGQFIHCNATLAEKFVANSSIITPEHIGNLKVFTDLLLASGQIPSLAFGTLLGWYRNCGVIPYTTDIDVAVKVAEYQDDFMESLKTKTDFRLLRYIGTKEYGLEITVKIPGTIKDAYVDVFYLFPHNSTYDWAPTTYGKSSGWLRLKTLVPKIEELCTGDVLGFLFFVPCNFLDVIVTSYGQTDWLEPQESYSYTGHDRLTFRDGNWNETLDDVIQHF